eukprot:773511-Pleurochrysis_carterae.AAC.1
MHSRALIRIRSACRCVSSCCVFGLIVQITAYPADGEGDVSRGGKVSLKRGRKFSSEEGRARGVAHGGEKWLWMHAHARASDCAAALRDKGFRLLGAVVPESDASA